MIKLLLRTPLRKLRGGAPSGVEGPSMDGMHLCLRQMMLELLQWSSMMSGNNRHARRIMQRFSDRHEHVALSMRGGPMSTNIVCIKLTVVEGLDAWYWGDA